MLASRLRMPLDSLESDGERRRQGNGGVAQEEATPHMSIVLAESQARTKAAQEQLCKSLQQNEVLRQRLSQLEKHVADMQALREKDRVLVEEAEKKAVVEEAEKKRVEAEMSALMKSLKAEAEFDYRGEDRELQLLRSTIARGCIENKNLRQTNERLRNRVLQLQEPWHEQAAEIGEQLVRSHATLETENETLKVQNKTLEIYRDRASSLLASLGQSLGFPVAPDFEPQPECEPQPEPEQPKSCDTHAPIKRTISEVTASNGHWSDMGILDITDGLVGEQVEVHDGDDGVWEKTGKRWPKTTRYLAILSGVNRVDGTVDITYLADPSKPYTNSPETYTITHIKSGQRIRFVATEDY
jgi:hypothetical protein